MAENRSENTVAELFRQIMRSCCHVRNNGTRGRVMAAFSVSALLAQIEET
jgi:hypothetical protein